MLKSVTSRGDFSEMEQRRIYLIRHGETEFNRLGVFRGRYDVDLNENGRLQAKEIARALSGENLEFIVTSPLKRALETAQAIASELGIEYRVEEGFNNINLGSWQGVPKEKIKREYPRLWHLWTTNPEKLLIPGGETLSQVRRRSLRALNSLLKRTKGNFGIVTHRAVIKALAAGMLGMRPPYFWKLHIDNASFSVFEVINDGFMLVSWNNNSHLSRKVIEIF